MEVCVIVLAAGAGTRMGGPPKLLLPWGGRPLLQHVLDAAADAAVGETIVVLGHDADRVAAALRLPPGARLVVHRGYAEGQGSSLRAGLGAAPPRAGAAVVLLGDQPGVRADAIRAVAGAAGTAPVARAAYDGRPGHPVLLARELWAGLGSGRGDQGARGIIAARAGEVALVEVGGEPPEDVDTPEAYARLAGGRAPAAPAARRGAGRAPGGA